MSRLSDFYIDHQLEPDLPIMSDRRAFHRDLHDLPIDAAREAYYRQTKDWQWQEEMAKREDERIEKQYEKGGKDGIN